MRTPSLPTWIVLGWERRPLASIGVRPFTWSSVAWGLGLAAVLMWAVTPLSLWALAKRRLPGFEAGIASFASLPLGLKLLAVLGAGWGPVLTFFVSGALLTAFYVWRQDLLANVVAHVVVDAMGLIMVPSLQRSGVT